jgi:hypothetical protein
MALTNVARRAVGAVHGRLEPALAVLVEEKPLLLRGDDFAHLLHGGYTVVIRRLHGGYVAVTLLLRGDDFAHLLHGGYTVVTWRSHGGYMAVALLLRGEHSAHLGS